MGLFDKIAGATQARVNAEVLNEECEIYALLEGTKVTMGEKGIFAIVESTVMESFSGPYKEGALVCHMQKKQKDFDIMERMVKQYVAINNQVDMSHEMDNTALWTKWTEEVFGKQTINEDGGFDFIHDNPMKGLILHYRVTDKTKIAKKAGKNYGVGDKVSFTEVTLLGLVEDKTKLSPTVLAKYADRLHPAYS